MKDLELEARVGIEPTNKGFADPIGWFTNPSFSNSKLAET
jgi:hypothetical protein